MSGGSMDYVASRIHDAADYIQRTLANYELRLKSGRLIRPSDFYAKEHPDKKWLADPKALTERVIKHLSDALKTAREAAIYARRVEWLTSGDDGEESFCLRTEEELADCRKHGGVE